ncbi:ABC transporter permease [Gordonia sp. X0973]|uniref:ABC transporter permease n=1 Tax=Gordonia sp. X0973 TaxID=2742602 RepID=UPI0026574C1C|nr:ABC transporter permease [Gordonia sp. X0973]
MSAGVATAVPSPAGAAHPNAVGQWWALSARAMRGVVVNGEVVMAFLSPAFLAVCFYLPLRNIMDVPGMGYAQFLMPIIVLQSTAFTASSAAMRSALDRQNGITTRFATLPMPAVVAPAARFSANLLLLGISLVCGAIAVLIIGWRPGGGVSGTLALIAIAAAIGACLMAIGDALGVVAPSPEATSQVLTLPILILGMVSTGFAPAQRFPTWIRGFAENQPISVWAETMRHLDGATGTANRLGASVMWIAVLAAVAVALMVLAARKTMRR